MHPEIIRQSVINILSYFEVFNYPLKKEEIINCLNFRWPGAAGDLILEELTLQKNIFQNKGFYSLHNNSVHIEQRIKSNARADEQMPAAIRAGRLISRFPFVKMVAISGSLSKNVADENSDFDFFIITKANRLWLARTLLHIFKKFTFLTGKQHRYCMNYFLDESALTIREKNIFTALEVRTVIPVTGAAVFASFYRQNEWVNDYFPFLERSTASIPATRRSMLQRLLEPVFSRKMGDHLDDRLMRITLNRWQKKTNQGKRGANGIALCMDAGKHYSKPHPAHLQEKIMTRYQLKKEQLLAQLHAKEVAEAIPA